MKQLQKLVTICTYEICFRRCIYIFNMFYIAQQERLNTSLMKFKHIPFFVIAASAIIATLSSFKPQKKFDLKASIERGKEIYTTHCVFCHMAEGQGMEGAFPPVAKADYLMADKKRSIEQVINGATGEMTVNGKVYNGEMKSTGLNDDEVSDVLNYIRNSFGNKGDAVTPEEVKKVRK